MVKAGEASGQLSSSLKWLADYLEKEQNRKSQIRSALAYPVLLIVVGTLAVTLLLLFVVPRFVTIFEEFQQALPLPTVILLGISGFLRQYWWAIGLAIAALSSGFKGYMRLPGSQYRLDRLKLSMPLFGKLNMKSAVSRFARTTATLLHGGVSLFDSMAIVREVVGNEVLVRGTDRIRTGMREGESFAERMQNAGVFPPLLTNMAAIGEETGDLRSVLINVADAYDVEVESMLKSLVSLIEPLIIIFVGGTIAFVIMSMLLPIFEMNMSAG
jgi:type II secretory pathway component PulF